MVGSVGNLKTMKEQEEARGTPRLLAQMLEPGTMWKKLIWGLEGVIEDCFRTLSPPCPHLFPFSPLVPLIHPPCSLNTPCWILSSGSLCSGCSLSLEHPRYTHSWLPCLLQFSAHMAPPHQGQTLATRLNTEPHPPHSLPFFFLLSTSYHLTLTFIHFVEYASLSTGVSSTNTGMSIYPVHGCISGDWHTVRA